MKTQYIAAILFATAATTSCTDFLDENVYTTVETDNFYKTATDLEAGLVAAYSDLQAVGYYDNIIFQVADLSTGMLDTRYTNNVYNRFSTEKDHNQYKTFWESCWIANNSIAHVMTFGPKVDMDEDQKNRVLAEASFLRALNYFNLVRVYGPVPLATKAITSVNDDLYPATQPLDSVYSLIIEDLKFAKQHLSNKEQVLQKGRATKGAAMALLGKVYLTYAGYRKAEDPTTIEVGDPMYFELAYNELDSLVKGHAGNYALFDNYGDMFSNDKENGIEDIFSIQYKQGALGAGASGGEGSLKQTHWAPQLGITHSAYETYRAVPAFYKKFLDADKRKAVTFLDKFVDIDGIDREYPATLTYPYVKKYIRDIREGGIGGFDYASARDGEENTIVLRYADVLLMHSEAVWGKNGKTPSAEAIEGINTVRRRAGLEDLNIANITTSEAFVNRLLDEREKELCFEGHGWFDYTRLGQLYERVDIKTATTANRFYTWPIPALEINKNKNLLQSPGW